MKKARVGRKTRTLADWRDVLAVLSMTLAAAVMFWPLFLRGEVLFFGDNLSLKLPNAIYAASRLRSGEVPLWNPYILAGMPFLADPSTTVLNPFMTLFMVLEPFQALSIATVVEILVAGVSAFFLGRALSLSRTASALLATTFMFSSTLMHYTAYLNLLASTSWLPLTLLSFHKAVLTSNHRWTSVGSLSLALQIAGGHPQPPVYTIFLLGAYALLSIPHRPLTKRLVVFLGTVAIALGLNAITLIPAAELTQLSTRKRITYQEATIDSLHPLLLTRLVLPNLFDNPKQGITWGPAWRHVVDNIGYVGIVPIILITFTAKSLLQRNSSSKRLFLFFASVAFFSLIMAMGKYTPLFPVAYNLLPFLRILRGPAEVMLLSTLGFAVLGGIALDRCRRFPLRSKTIHHFSIVAATIVAVALVVYSITSYRFDLIWQRTTPFHTFERDRAIIKMVTANLVISSTLALLAIWAIKRRRLTAMLCIAFLDLLIFNSRYLFTIPRENLLLSSSRAAELRMRMTPQERFASYQDVEPFTGLGNYWENVSLRPPFADSFYTKHEATTAAILRQRINDSALNWNMVYSLPSVNGYASFILSDFADYFSSSASGQERRLNNVDLSLVDSHHLNELAVAHWLEKTGVRKNLQALPRVRVVDNSGDLVSAAKILVDDPERIVLTAKAPIPATLILADSHYPGWIATINGKTAEIKKEKGLLRAVEIPAGESLIEFRFRPQSVMIGAIVSIASACAALILLFARNSMERRPNGDTNPTRV